MNFTVQLSPADLAAGAAATIDFRSFGETGSTMTRYAIDKRGAGLMTLDMALTSTLLGKNAGADLASAMSQALTSGQVVIDPKPTHANARVNVAILASNHVVRRIFRTAQPGGGAPWFDPGESAFADGYVPAGLPLVIAATVAGVAAIGGVTYYATEAKRITVSFDKLTAQLAHQAELYKTQVAAAVQTNTAIPAPPKVVQDMADAEIAGMSVWPLVAAAVAGGAGVAAYMFRSQPAPARRSNPRPPTRKPLMRAGSRRKPASRKPRRRDNPLAGGYSVKTWRINVAKMRSAGYPEAQALAAATRQGRTAWRKKHPRKEFPEHLKLKKAPARSSRKKAPTKPTTKPTRKRKTATKRRKATTKPTTKRRTTTKRSNRQPTGETERARYMRSQMRKGRSYKQARADWEGKARLAKLRKKKA